MPVAQSVTVEELFTAAGFFILTYSVYTDQPTTTN